MKGFFLGTPLPLNEPGLACPVCWGPGKPFGPGPTPKFIKLTFTGIHVGSSWFGSGYPDPNQTYLCVLGVDVCYWSLNCWPIDVWLELGPVGSQAYLRIYTIPLFQSTVMSVCVRDFTNIWFSPSSPNQLGGSCRVSWEMDGLI